MLRRIPLVTGDMPVVVIALNGALLEKLEPVMVQ
jgi:hypothetical protein